MQQAIWERAANDPLIGAKVAGRALSERLIAAFAHDGRGAHIESVLCAAGALAGHACQVSVRRANLAAGRSETDGLIAVETANGSRYFMGDSLNAPLAESQYSVWALSAGASQSLGATELPDLADIFGHVSKTLGALEFGLPRIPEGHRPGDSPIHYLRALWNQADATASPYCLAPSDLPIAFGLAIQDLIEQGKDLLSPALAVTIVMESAVPMSKVELSSA